MALNDYKTVYNDFVSKAPLPKNTNYTVVYPHFDYNVPNIKRLLADDGSIYNSMIQNSANRNYVSQVLLYNAENRALFTKLGSTVTQRTKELALSITKNCKTGYEKVDAIKAYLSKNYIYTLNTTPLPKGADLVDEFLFKSKKGYCVHFASSMVILLRACNVPARYVEGYVSPTASVNGLYKITSSQAHAWVEVYSNILGFYTVEATPGFSYVGSAQGQVDSAVSSVSSSQANSQESSEVTTSTLPVNSLVSEPTSSSTDKGVKISLRKMVGYILLSLFIILLLAVTLKLLSRMLWLKLIIRHSKLEQVLLLYRHYISVLSKISLPRLTDETPFEFDKRIEKSISFGSCNFGEVTQIFVRAEYGNYEPQNSESEMMIEFTKKLPYYCRKNIGLLRYLWLFFLI